MSSSPTPTPPPHSSALLIAGAYFLYFALVGVTLPFLPAYFRAIGFTPTEIGVLLAITPVATLFAPTWWGRIADRTRRPDRVLVFLALGTAIAFVPLLFVGRFAAVALTLAVYALFASAMTTVLDSLALAHVAKTGGAFARVRLFGSLGFVVSSSILGFSVAEIDRSAIVVAQVLLWVSLAWSFYVRRHESKLLLGAMPGAAPPAPRAPIPRGAALQLLKNPAIALLCAGSTLHWIAAAPFHGAIAIHTRDLGLPPSVVGLSVALGVVAEMVVMFFYARIAARVSARVVLVVAFLGTAARWAGMSVATSAEAIVLLSLLHGLTFGAFYTGSVGYLAKIVPPELRATGQSLFAATSFGVGGLIGYVFGGLGYDALESGHRLFAVAVGVELVATLFVARLPSERRASSS